MDVKSPYLEIMTTYATGPGGSKTLWKIARSEKYDKNIFFYRSLAICKNSCPFLLDTIKILVLSAFIIKTLRSKKTELAHKYHHKCLRNKIKTFKKGNRTTPAKKLGDDRLLFLLWRKDNQIYRLHKWRNLSSAVSEKRLNL